MLCHSSGSATEGQGATAPQKFSWSLRWPPYFSKRVQKCEFRIHCLLRVLANENDVQGMKLILLDCYCALTYTKCYSSFLCVFWLWMQATTYRKFLNINDDLVNVISVMSSSCTLYFSVILPAFLHFCLKEN